ncbi:recombinase family protein [Arthrobacter agilis]|uniref:recombinase family protein n=1 Tax=Arthrobacter agilis TaxID=37921 RepID=UPI003605DB7A
MKIGYARVSTKGQDLTAQRNALLAFGVEAENIHVDHGFTGANRTRQGLREALASCRKGDTLVVTKLDRLARSLSDARDIVDELTRKGVALIWAAASMTPTDPIGRLLFNVLGMVAEFESDLIRMRTREGMPTRESQRTASRQAPNSPPASASTSASVRRRRAHPGRDR